MFLEKNELLLRKMLIFFCFLLFSVYGKELKGTESWREPISILDKVNTYDCFGSLAIRYWKIKQKVVNKAVVSTQIYSKISNIDWHTSNGQCLKKHKLNNIDLKSSLYDICSILLFENWIHPPPMIHMLNIQTAFNFHAKIVQKLWRNDRSFIKYEPLWKIEQKNWTFEEKKPHLCIERWRCHHSIICLNSHQAPHQSVKIGAISLFAVR